MTKRLHRRREDDDADEFRVDEHLPTRMRLVSDACGRPRCPFEGAVEQLLLGRWEWNLELRTLPVSAESMEVKVFRAWWDAGLTVTIVAARYLSSLGPSTITSQYAEVHETVALEALTPDGERIHLPIGCGVAHRGDR